MPAAIFAAAAVVGAEAIGFAMAESAVAWSWGSVAAKASMVANRAIAFDEEASTNRHGAPKGEVGEHR